MPKNEYIGLLKISNSSIIPTKLNRKKEFKGDGTINPDDFYLEIDEELKEKYIANTHNHYSRFKSDLFLPEMKINKKADGFWNMVESSAGTSDQISNSPIRFFTPVNATDVFFKLLISRITKELSSIFPKKESINFFFTQPSYQDTTKSRRYRDRVRTILKDIVDDSKIDRINFPQISNQNEYFLSEPNAVYYHYAGLENKIEDKVQGGTYLIIDSGGSTTDVSIIQMTKKGKVGKGRKIPISDSVAFGGSDLDSALFNQLLGDLAIAESSHKERILENIEKAKISISKKILSNPDEPVSEPIKINNRLAPELSSSDLKDVFIKKWPKVRKLILDLIEKAINTGAVIEFNGFTNIFLAGGTSQFPYFYESLISDKQLRQYIHKENIVFSKEVNLSNIASLGLAYELFIRNNDENISDKHKNLKLNRAKSIYGKFKNNGFEFYISRKNKADKGLLFDVLEVNSIKKNEELSLDKAKFDSILLNKEISIPQELGLFLKTDLQREFSNNADIIVPIKKLDKSNHVDDNEIGLSLEISNPTNIDNGLSFISRTFLWLNNERLDDKEIKGRRTKIEFPVDSLSLTAPNIPQNNNDIFVAVDFGMSNTSVAVYAPGKELDKKHFDSIFTIPISADTKIPQPKIEEKLNPEVQFTETDAFNLKSLFKVFEKGLEIHNPNLEKISELTKNMKDFQSYFKEVFTGNSDEYLPFLDYLQVISGSIKRNKNEHPYLIIKKEIEYVEGLEPNLKKNDFSLFKKFIESKNYIYSIDNLKNIWTQISNNNSRIIILAGPPGTGKTSLVSLVAEYYNSDVEHWDDIFYNLIPISPAWFSTKNLIGYYNELESKFEITNFFKTLKLAELHYNKYKEKSRKFFVCLDEFNIAQPEQYFSDILSLMETPEKPLKVCDGSHFEGRSEALQVRVTPNIKFFATINTDASSKHLSPKVIDRSMFLHLKPSVDDIIKFAKKNSQKYSLQKFYTEFEKGLKLLYEVSDNANTPLGFRVIEQAFSFIANHPDSKDSYKEIIPEIVISFFLSRLPGADEFENEEYVNSLTKIRNHFKNNEHINSIVGKILNNYPGQASF